MSGLEAVGAIAAIAQLATYGCNALASLQALRSELRAAPHRLQQRADYLQSLVGIIESIERISRAQPSPIQGTLDSITINSNAIKTQLSHHLRSLKSKSLKRYWKAAVLRTQEQEILEALAVLEQHKTSLIVYLTGDTYCQLRQMDPHKLDSEMDVDSPTSRQAVLVTGTRLQHPQNLWEGAAGMAGCDNAIPTPNTATRRSRPSQDPPASSTGTSQQCGLNREATNDGEAHAPKDSPPSARSGAHPKDADARQGPSSFEWYPPTPNDTDPRQGSYSFEWRSRIPKDRDAREGPPPFEWCPPTPNDTDARQEPSSFEWRPRIPKERDARKGPSSSERRPHHPNAYYPNYDHEVNRSNEDFDFNDDVRFGHVFNEFESGAYVRSVETWEGSRISSSKGSKLQFGNEYGSRKG